MTDVANLAVIGARRMFNLARALTAVYTQPVPGTYDPATDTYSGSTTVNYAVRALFEQEKVQNQAGNTVVIEYIPKLIILAESVPPGFTPSPNDTVEVKGTNYTVITFTVIQLGGTIIAYVLVLKV